MCIYLTNSGQYKPSAIDVPDGLDERVSLNDMQSSSMPNHLVSYIYDKSLKDWTAENDDYDGNVEITS